MSATFSKAFAAALACLLYATPTSALWRLQCDGVSGNARIDPLVDPGVPSGHLHAIHGGSGKTHNNSSDSKPVLKFLQLSPSTLPPTTSSAAPAHPAKSPKTSLPTGPPRSTSKMAAQEH